MLPDDGYSPAAPAALDLEDAYRSYHEPLVSFLSNKLPEKSVAADIAHTVFAALAARPSLQPIRNMRQYLFRAARNQLADYYRKEKAQEEGAERFKADPAAPAGETAPCPEDEAIRRDKLNRLRAIIAAMPEKRRQVFMLARFQELTETEIAERLAMKPDAVSKHVSRAMRDCKREMLKIFDDAPANQHAEDLNGRGPRHR
ncbi:MAG TPA: sigma-70 family RNA polymerase sigma factor [Parvularculaceae bacterium]|nr:sigma-70 family RNA polymerase sigma factor [Parvularculaceae bacterium]HRX40329.1 sigma-70 family RNA polymerase sigma factor [Parvularculaceae bacterium]